MRTSVTTWSLESTDPADLRRARPPRAGARLDRACRPSPELGRYLYTAVGGHWYWTDRLAWTYAQWLERLSHPRVETWLATSEGTPVGYFELDGSRAGEVEIAYFGLLPAAIGQGFGGWLLTEAIQRAWAMGAGRVWVHTCTLDGPAALANYRARGLRVVNERTELVELEGEPPGPWPGAAAPGARTLP